MPYKHHTAQHHGGSTYFAAGQPQNLAVVLKSVGLQGFRLQDSNTPKEMCENDEDDGGKSTGQVLCTLFHP